MRLKSKGEESFVSSIYPMVFADTRGQATVLMTRLQRTETKLGTQPQCAAQGNPQILRWNLGTRNNLWPHPKQFLCLRLSSIFTLRLSIRELRK
jgi:hypothetical protein